MLAHHAEDRRRDSGLSPHEPAWPLSLFLLLNIPPVEQQWQQRAWKRYLCLRLTQKSTTEPPSCLLSRCSTTNGSVWRVSKPPTVIYFVSESVGVARLAATNLSVACFVSESFQVVSGKKHIRPQSLSARVCRWWCLMHLVEESQDCAQQQGRFGFKAAEQNCLSGERMKGVQLYLCKGQDLFFLSISNINM